MTRIAHGFGGMTESVMILLLDERIVFLNGFIFRAIREIRGSNCLFQGESKRAVVVY